MKINFDAVYDIIIQLNILGRYLMALRIQNGKVVSIAPPKLTKKQLEKMENAPRNEKLIKEALSTKFNIVYQH